jgi:hypothetical protein
MASAASPESTAAAVAHALRSLNTPSLTWAAQFLLSGNAAAAHRLTSSSSLDNKALVLTVAVSTTGPTPSTVSADILLLPALSIGSLVIGFAKMRDDYGLALDSSFNIAKFLLSIDTGETLLLGPLVSDASDGAGSPITALAEASRGTRSNAVPSAVGNEAGDAVRLMWWAPEDNGRRLSAVLDWRCIQEKRYADSIYVSSYTPSAVRRACISCAERTGVVVCGCELQAPQNSGASLEFSKLGSNMERLGGLFVGNCITCVRGEDGSLACFENAGSIKLKLRQITQERNMQSLMSHPTAGSAGKLCEDTRIVAEPTVGGSVEQGGPSGWHGLHGEISRDGIRSQFAEGSTVLDEANAIEWATGGGLEGGLPPLGEYLDDAQLESPAAPMMGGDFLMAGGMSMVAPCLSGSVSPLDLGPSGDWAGSSSDAITPAESNSQTLEEMNAMREARAERRREKNREAARVSNARRKHRNDTLKAGLRDARLLIHRLRARYLALSAENDSLRGQLAQRPAV